MARSPIHSLCGTPRASIPDPTSESRVEERELVEQALHIPRREAARWRHTPLDQEDLVAEGNLALARAARRYDPSLDTPFAAFAAPFVRGAVIDIIRVRARRAALGDGRYAAVIGFADVGGTTEEASFEPTDPSPTPHETLETLDRLRVLGTLPEREREALVRTVIDGDSADEVARDLGVTADRVHTLARNGSTRLRKRAG